MITISLLNILSTGLVVPSLDFIDWRIAPLDFGAECFDAVTPVSQEHP